MIVIFCTLVKLKGDVWYRTPAVLWVVENAGFLYEKLRFFATNRSFSYIKWKPFILETWFLSHSLGNFVELNVYLDHFFVKTLRFIDIRHFPPPTKQRTYDTERHPINLIIYQQINTQFINEVFESLYIWVCCVSINILTSASYWDLFQKVLINY